MLIQMGAKIQKSANTYTRTDAAATTTAAALVFTLKQSIHMQIAQ